MKYLLIIRHAKTEQQNFDKDFERELTERGKNDCKLMSQRLKKNGFKPDLIKISPSKRTKQTANYFAKYLDWNENDIENIEKLYLANYEVIFQEVANTNESVNSLAIIGHNPGISEFFNYIGNSTIDDLPTCAVGLFEFEINDWKDIAAHTGTLEWYSWPKKEES